MATKDILKNAHYMPTAVGDKVYVWSEAGKKPAARARNCVVSAHGSQAL
jgi:hypothetical protein